MKRMNTVTLPKSEYMKILETQENLEHGLARLEKFIFQIAQDEVNPTYKSRLTKIENQTVSGKTKKLKNKSEVRAFFASL